VALAEAEQTLGLDISDEQIAEMKEHITDINYDVARAREKEVRHDVMSHVYAYGVQCPKAAGIIHLGATSCFVTDNTDILNINEGLSIIKKRLVGVIKLLADFSDQYKDMPTLGYTHGQPASPVTVGRRSAMWLQNFMENLDELEFVQENLKMLGCRGATGTQETFMKLFDGDEEKVKAVDAMVAEKFGFDKVYPISGQTYPRNLDVRVLNCLSAIAVSAYKMAEDIRILQHDKEMEEPFEKKQIGSSAMAYKRNPMRSERICSLARYVQNEAPNAVNTANTQWLERTLDDSANRRMSIPESFLAIDGVLIICANVTNGLVVNDKIIGKRLDAELPFMATEDILMKAVKAGGNRQELHEAIRVHSMEAGRQVKVLGLENDLVQRIADDPAFGMTLEEVKAVLDPKNLVGRCPNQVTDYLENYVNPVLEKNEELLTDINTDVRV
jgi:adenylosuccinate lyase